MLIVLSPAKRLDFETPPHVTAHSQPRFLTQARTLVGLLKKLDARELASLMSISDPLAALNVARYGQWKPPFTPRNARPALLAFAGDVYEGLDATSLKRPILPGRRTAYASCPASTACFARST